MALCVCYLSNIVNNKLLIDFADLRAIIYWTPFFYGFTRMYSFWRIDRLKEELRKRGASLKGKKADLVERLEAYDRNFNFENPADDSPEPQMDLPDEQFFRDVNSNTVLPTLTKQHINTYFSRFNKKTDDRWRLYESRYLLVLRSCKQGDDVFLKGVCKASMKKINYEVNCKMQMDGNIDETMCECAVGSGKEAHCKHVATILFAAEDMQKTKTMITHIVCTQKLQSFHRPKKAFTASPLKAHRLPSKRKLEKVLFHPYPMNMIDKENYNTRVRNICIGASCSMPIKQMFGPANPYGILNDHKYEQEDARDILLKNFDLVKISSKKVRQIELHTHGQANNPEWHKHRQNRITASRFHTVCHLTQINQKNFASQLLTPKKFTSRATTHGIVNESVAIQKYGSQYDLAIRECGLFISKEHPFLAASPDGLLGDETVIEVKCPYSCRYLKIDETTVPYLCRKDGELCLKETSIYYYQIQGQLYCANKKYCNFIIYTFVDMLVIYISRNNAFIAGMVVKLAQFFENHFKDSLYDKHIFRNYK